MAVVAKVQAKVVGVEVLAMVADLAVEVGAAEA